MSDPTEAQPTYHAIPPYQQRVIDEKYELDQKILRLSDFIGSEKFQGLPAAERDRLERQFKLMMLYSLVLKERIAAFK